MTPSQSKIKTSVLSKSCEEGSESFITLALIAVLKRGVDRVTKALEAGANAEAVDAMREVSASCVHFIVRVMEGAMNNTNATTSRTASEVVASERKTCPFSRTS